MSEKGKHTSSRTQIPSTVLNRRRHMSEESRSSKSLLADIWDLSKPEITLTVVMTAAAAFILGSAGKAILGPQFYFLLSGTFFLAVASGALNHFIEREIDATMHRTASRPIPSGRMKPSMALLFGVSSFLIGAGLMYMTNLLTFGLGVSTVLLYLWVYTPLKKTTKMNTLVGCLPGALPALGGWTAATGSIGLTGLAFFGVLFFWQMPHFLSLSWMYRKDYTRGKLAMTAVDDSDGRVVSSQAVAYSLVAILLSTIPTITGSSGLTYLTIILLFGAFLLYKSIVFLQQRDNQNAKSLLKASIYYIPGLLVAVLVDFLV